MSEFDNLKNEAEQYAQQHPQQIKEGEEGEEAVEKKFGMGQQDPVAGPATWAIAPPSSGPLIWAADRLPVSLALPSVRSASSMMAGSSTW